MGKINIAIDGPAGAGKSTVAKEISKRLGILYLDTGAMYRAVAFKALEQGIDTRDAENLSNMIKNIDLNITYENQIQEVYLDGERITNKIRTPEISVGASNVGVVPDVRIKMVELQRNIAKDNSLVIDGRDIGSYVIPDAEVKIFLTASLDERAKRRFEEQIAKGETNVVLEEVRKDIEYRDENDSKREFAPLCVAKDAVVVDSTKSSVSEIVEKIIEIIRWKDERYK